MGGNAVMVALSTALASAFAYLTVVASPTCMIIHSSGLVKSSDYLRAGWKMTVMSIAVLLLFIHLFWPLMG
jgi:di/tricarboxylate transporter